MKIEGGNVQDQMRTARFLVKTEATIESMSQYHKDLIKWSRNIDKRYAWVVLGVLWMLMAASLGAYRVYGLVFAKITAEKFYTREEATWPVSMVLTVENLAGPFASILVYYISFRWSLLIGITLCALGNGLAYWSDSLTIDVLLIGFIQGCGYAFIFMPFMEIINNYFFKYRNAALGFSLLGGTISVFAWAPLYQWILDTYHWRTVYAIMGSSCAITIPLVLLLKPNPRPTPPKTGTNKRIAEATTSQRMSFRALSYQNSLRRQSTISIARLRTNQGTFIRGDSIISVNPFASSVGMERKISRVVSSARKPSQQDAEQQQQAKPIDTITTIDPINNKEQLAPVGSNVTQLDKTEYETLSLSEMAEEAESDFNISVVWSILKTPGFHLIWYLDVIFYWIFSIYCLVLVDYGVDRGLTKDQSEQLISYQSVGEIIGRGLLTIVVDMKFLSNGNTVILNLVLLSVALVVNTLISGMFWFSVLTIAITALSSLLYILLNGLLVDYLGERNVTIGYGMSSSICGLLITMRPQAVGYFRDTMGSYDQLLLWMAGACLLGGVLVIIEPLITRFCCKNDTKDIEDEDY